MNFNVMEIINLVEFVKSWEMFEKIEGHYQQIVSDFDFGRLEWFVKIDNIWDFKKIDKTKRTLFIIDKILYKNIKEFFDMKNFSIIDMNFWINSCGNKLTTSKLDVKFFLDEHIDIYEPYDLSSFLFNLELDGKNYIRINQNELPLNFGEENSNKDFLDLSSKWFDGQDLVLISSGSMISEIIRVNYLLAENWIFTSIVLLNKLSLDMEILKLNSKNLIFILDIENTKFYEKLVETKLKGFNIKFIYPEYWKFTTILNEYICQDFEFDAEFLFEKIKKSK